MTPDPDTMNPPFDECPCQWGRAEWQAEIDAEAWQKPPSPVYIDLGTGERCHRMLLDLEGERPQMALALFLLALRDGDVPMETAVRTLVAQHNWRDPVAMTELAEGLDLAWSDARRLRYLEDVARGVRKPITLPNIGRPLATGPGLLEALRKVLQAEDG